MTLIEGVDLTDTIAAISTPIGMGGIGIIRISGPLSHTIGKEIFQPRNARDKIIHRKMILGDIIDPERKENIDEVFVVFMFSPHTYTREDMVEIQCHSGRVVLERILKLIMKQNARLAGPGEFTLRAYLNGRIDLTQAEGVIEVIQAQSEASLRMAQVQLRGKVNEEIKSILQPINKILMYIEADLDFSEDTGMDFTLTWEEIWKNTKEKLLWEINRLMEGFTTCQMMREGLEVVIVGPTNVGKSSILNRFVGRERAIVTDVPGTTRDFIEEGVLILGIPFRIVDTAGLRPSNDPVEKIGTEQTDKKRRHADIVLLVLDGSKSLTKSEKSLLEMAEKGRTIIVVNKCDLVMSFHRGDVLNYLKEGIPIVEVSAKTGENWEKLIHLIVDEINRREVFSETDALIPVNQRHFQLLEKTRMALERFDQGMKEGREEVFLSEDLWEAKSALEAIIGKTPRDYIISEVFQNFCIGK